MESFPILLPAAVAAAGLFFILQTTCIICIHRRVKRLEAVPAQQQQSISWLPEPTHYGLPVPQWQAPVPVPQWQAPPSPSAPDWRVI